MSGAPNVTVEFCTTVTGDRNEIHDNQFASAVSFYLTSGIRLRDGVSDNVIGCEGACNQFEIAGSAEEDSIGAAVSVSGEATVGNDIITGSVEYANGIPIDLWNDRSEYGYSGR